MNEVKQNAVIRMQKSVDALKLDLSKIRTGRAHAGILDHISVDYYGTQTLLTQLANITVADATTINIQPYEKTMIQTIEKVIRESDLGLNPSTSGELIRIPMPALTEERRKDLIKVVKSEGENSKIAIRNIRRDCNEILKKMSKVKEISEDDERRMQEEIQKITDEFIIEIDKLINAKEKDLLAI
ncbi:ribosome recycling factor [Methylophilaceae bacterium]|jgi:ribosome recycling factor|nr:ribosome recycling factor [Methylophilaceae bacterium]|tara:strand:- start:1384 stop:1938 length:555 start_codon:yes stop_codon:yes gene_type:complete